MYLDWLSNKLNIKTMEDWYNVTWKDLIDNNGKGLVNNYDNSHVKAITTIYSDYKWLPWLFHSISKGYWSNKNNQIEYMKWLSNKLNINKMEDWYNVTLNDFTNNGGWKLVNLYDNSHIKLIMSIYNEYDWLPWKFNSVPKGYWEDKQNQLKYMNWLANEIKIKTMEDWYNVNVKQILNNGGGGLLTLYGGGSPLNLLKSVYPNINWLTWKFNRTKRNFLNQLNEGKNNK